MLASKQLNIKSFYERKKMTAKQRKLRRKRLFNQKIKDYTKFLKDDIDGDYSCILYLLKYKLERTRDCIGNGKLVMDHALIAKQIDQVVTLLDRVLKDDYESKYEEERVKQYGKHKIWNTKLPNGMYEMHSKYEKETPENSKEIRRHMKRGWRKADQEKKRDLKKAFDIMLKYIWNWWD